MKKIFIKKGVRVKVDLNNLILNKIV